MNVRNLLRINTWAITNRTYRNVRSLAERTPSAVSHFTALSCNEAKFEVTSGDASKTLTVTPVGILRQIVEATALPMDPKPTKPIDDGILAAITSFADYNLVKAVLALFLCSPVFHSEDRIPSDVQEEHRVEVFQNNEDKRKI